MFSHNLTWIFMRFIFKGSNWLPIRWFKKLFSWSMDVLKLRREKKCDSAYKLHKRLLNPGAITRRGEDILSYSWHVCFWWAGRFFFFMMCERNEGCFIIQEFVPISACLPGNSPVILPDFLLCFRDCDKYEFFMDELILSSYCK